MAKERPAPGDLELVRGFVNTLDIEAGTDDMKTPDELRGWLVSNGLLEPGTTVTVADVRRAVELREALRALLLANNGVAAPASAAAVLDNVARRARLGPRFRADGTSPLEPDADRADGSL